MNNFFQEKIQKFQEKHFANNKQEFERLAKEGQTPKTLFISCADSRVIPEQLTSSKPGDLFVVRNIGNIVPTYETANGFHGVTAAIEYAVEILQVENIIVCGHSHCGAIRALYEPPTKATEHIKNWLSLAEKAKVNLELQPLSEQILRQTEQNSIALQVSRLSNFPCIAQKLEQNKINITGWHFYIENGQIKTLNKTTNSFE